MPSTVFDSFFFKDRFGTAQMRAIWDDRTTHQRWLDVEAALAQAESAVGVIPEKVAREITGKAKIENLDLEAMKADFDRTWNPVIPLINALRKVVSPASARYIHWGCTSKNIFDTGMVLQVKDSYQLLLGELDKVTAQLVDLTERHRETVMTGRTHGQHAIPITFGFKTATWLDEIDRHYERLLASRKRVLVGELGGAVGTFASLGEEGLRVQAHLMELLGLGIPEVSVKTAGDRLAEFVLLLCLLSATLGKIAQNIYNLQQTDIDEVTECTEGKVGSSAMPHKQNPVASGSVVFLGRLLRANAGPALDYVQAEWEDDHRQGETAWKFLPEVCLLASAQLAIMERLLSSLVVKPENMLRNLERGGGLAMSESLMMALAEPMGRDAAHELVGELAAESRARTKPFREVVAQHPIVRRHLAAEEIERCLDHRNTTGLSAHLVDRVLAAHRKSSKSRQHD